MNKFTLVQVRNPFKVQDRDIQEQEARKVSLVEYIPPGVLTDLDHFLINSRKRTLDELKAWVPQPGDFVIICPCIRGGGGGGGKNVASVVGMLALTVVSFGVGALVSGVSLGAVLAGTASFTMWGWLAVGATMWLGGSMVSGTAAQPKAEIPSFAQQDATYGWGKLSPTMMQGGPVPLTYGTIRTAGQVVSQHVASSGDKQFLYVLLCGGEGPVDSITDIKVNDNPITNYSGITLETRLGTNTQDIISFFGDSYADQAVGFELTPGSDFVFTTESAVAQGLEIAIEWPGGLFFIADDGSPQNETVKISSWRKKTTDSSWTQWMTEVEVTSNSTAAVRRSFSCHGLDPAKYDVQVRMTRVTGHDTSRYMTRAVWTTCSAIIPDDFSRPNKVLIGILALATDQLSGGFPAITWTQTRSTVWIWNPNTSAYEAKAATNPAWAAYDLIHRCKRLVDPRDSSVNYVVQGEEAAKIDYTSFAAWATFCDVSVGGAARCTVNLQIDQAKSRWEQLVAIAQIGRGLVILRGTLYSCIWDGVSTPVQMFTVGNTTEDSFRGEYLPTRDRANAIEVSFFNEAKGYQRDTFIVYGEGWDTSSSAQTPTQVFFQGITNYARAYREALYRLRLNRYITRAISLNADVDGIACQVGDVINIQHDVPRWGYGGRIVAATASTVVLDRDVELLASKTYVIKVRLKDNTVVSRTLTAVGVDTITRDISVDTPFTVTPEQFDVYALGESGKEVKPFRAVKMGRASDMRVRIDAVEYYDEIYDESATVPDIDYTLPRPTVSDLRLGFHLGPDGLRIIDVSWKPPRGQYGGSLVLLDGQQIARVGWETTSYMISVFEDRWYTVEVRGLDLLGNPTGKISAQIQVEMEPPADVQNFRAYQDGDVVDLLWSANQEPDVEYYEIREGSSWESGILIVSKLSSTSFTYRPGIERTYRFMIKAVDRTKLESAGASVATVDVTRLFLPNVVVSTDELTLRNGTHVRTTFADGAGRWEDMTLDWEAYSNRTWDDMYRYRLDFTGME